MSFEADSRATIAAGGGSAKVVTWGWKPDCSQAAMTNAVVVVGRELTREEQERLVLEAGDWNRVHVGEAMASADEKGEWLGAQELAADSSHRVGKQRDTDVKLASEYERRDLRTEDLAGDD